MEQYNKFQEFFTRQLTIISNKQNFFLENFKKGIFGINDFEKLGFMDFSLAFDKSNIEFFENLGVIQPKEIKLVDIKELDEDEDIKDCITEPINNHFVWGKYGEFKVVICKKNSYINGSHLYAEAVKYENALKIKNGLNPSTPAKINKWFDNEKTVELFESAAENEGLDINDLSFILGDKQKKGQEMLKGTYLHPILINSLAMFSFFCFAKKRADFS